MLGYGVSYSTFNALEYKRLPPPESAGPPRIFATSTTYETPRVEVEESDDDSGGSESDASFSDSDSEEPSSSPLSKSKGFRNGRTPKPSDVFIAVMGVTGSGKSSFISTCSGKRVKIGHRLEACTTTVDVYPCTLFEDRTVYLIDTPGFDDTDKSDNEVLREIAAWLADSYQNKILLHGIIYLHRITDVRMQGSAKRNLGLFRELCGEDALQKVILATTMWDKVSGEEGYRREAELMDTQEFWGWMVDKGSKVHRHYNTKDSAMKIIGQLANHDKKFVTDLQRQLVDEGRTLDQTSAGKELQSELLKERERWAEKLRSVQAEMEAAMEKNDKEVEKIMREERDRYTRMIEQVENKTAALRVTMESLIARRDERVARMEKALREQQEKHAAHGNLPKRAAGGRAVLGKAKEPKGFPPFSVSWFGSEFSLTSGRSFNSNVAVPDRRATPGTKASATIVGERSDDKTSWVARYSDESWGRSKFFERCYPHLDGKFRGNGDEHLTVCALGADEQYYARWTDGSWSCYAYDTTVTALKEVVKKSKKKADWGIQAVALGYGTSYLISYGSSRKLRYRCDLKNYYPQLQRFLEAEKPLNVLAVALNPRSKTDYILVFSKRDGCPVISWICSNKAVNKEIQAWADKTAELAQGASR
ncbi:hypothetical protein CEP53_002877 [Fusarium sp. AF-6]|nr:hypothetical protein CEP53_002877 [Fusarium sp. AF-6]